MELKRKDLLDIKGLNQEEIRLILDTAESFKEVTGREIKKVPTLRGKTVVNLFFEPSTRTRTSFEIAAKRLSADVINFSVSGSSVSKGETLLDTARNIEAMRADFIIIRHQASGAPHILARNLRSSVINAGDGLHEHPTQALLDMFTILREFANLYCLTEGRVGHAKGDVMIMHPGPVNRGIEISPEVADGLSSVILEQVTNGVGVRMAVLYLLSGTGEKLS